MENTEICSVYYKSGEDSTDICIFCGEADYISTVIRWNHRFYEPNLLAFIETNYHTQRTILDIGANIGNHSLFFAKFLEYDRIISFEPMEVNIQLFKKNLEHYKDKCTLIETALGSEECEMTLYNTYDQNNGGYSVVNQPNTITVGTIKVATLDSFEIDDVSFIKLDVENYEAEVLRGGKNTIMRCKPMIMLENSFYYFSNLFPNPNPHQEIMEEMGYERIHTNLCDSSMDVWVSK